MNILLIEDEPELREIVQASLKKEGFLVQCAENFGEGLKKIRFYDYDCILLDIMLPGGDGLHILKHLKNIGKSENVIIISARNSVDDKIEGLNLGADDYLAKPFHMAELNARIKSVLRRKTFEGNRTLECGNVKMDLDNFSISVDGISLVLNRKEFDILVHLMTNRSRLVSKSSIAEKVWGDYMDTADDYEFIYSQVKNLRRKLKAAGAEVKITAMYGMGYKLEV